MIGEADRLRRAQVPNAEALRGARVMVVEDELLVAMLIEETLIDYGCVVTGPFSTVGSALAAAQEVAVDAAVLDVNLRGERVYPVAEMLAARGIPFLLLSGYGRDGVPPAHPEWQACAKPFLPRDLVATIAQLLMTARRDAPTA